MYVVNVCWLGFIVALSGACKSDAARGPHAGRAAVRAARHHEVHDVKRRNTTTSTTATTTITFTITTWRWRSAAVAPSHPCLPEARTTTAAAADYVDRTKPVMTSEAIAGRSMIMMKPMTTTTTTTRWWRWWWRVESIRSGCGGKTSQPSCMLKWLIGAMSHRGVHRLVICDTIFVLSEILYLL